MKIILDDKEVSELVPQSLPMLIHGTEGAGASMYTIALSVKWFSQGYKILCLCGYPMAEEKFTSLVGEHENATFYTKEKIEQFQKDVEINSDAILIIKNVELFEVDILKSIPNRKLIIISGDLDKCSFKEEVLKTAFVSEVYFSKLSEKDFPDNLNKYQGLLISGEFKGITRLE